MADYASIYPEDTDYIPSEITEIKSSCGCGCGGHSEYETNAGGWLLLIAGTAALLGGIVWLWDKLSS